MAMSEGLSKVDKFVYVVDIVIKDKYGRFSGNDGHIYNIKLYDKEDPTILRLDINVTKAAVLTSSEDYFDLYLDND